MSCWRRSHASLRSRWKTASLRRFAVVATVGGSVAGGAVGGRFDIRAIPDAGWQFLGMFVNEPAGFGDAQRGLPASPSFTPTGVQLQEVQNIGLRLGIEAGMGAKMPIQTAHDGLPTGRAAIAVDRRRGKRRIPAARLDDQGAGWTSRRRQRWQPEPGARPIL